MKKDDERYKIVEQYATQPPSFHKQVFSIRVLLHLGVISECPHTDAVFSKDNENYYCITCGQKVDIESVNQESIRPLIFT